MSTYWYFECLDHDPPLQSEDEFTQHTGDRYFEVGRRLALGAGVLDLLDNDDTSVYFRDNALRFLKQHLECNLGLVNEYGDKRGLKDV